MRSSYAANRGAAQQVWRVRPGGWVSGRDRKQDARRARRSRKHDARGRRRSRNTTLAEDDARKTLASWSGDLSGCRLLTFAWNKAKRHDRLRSLSLQTTQLACVACTLATTLRILRARIVCSDPRVEDRTCSERQTPGRRERRSCFRMRPVDDAFAASSRNQQTGPGALFFFACRGACSTVAKRARPALQTRSHQ
jgi:hypothetical protein